MCKHFHLGVYIAKLWEATTKRTGKRRKWHSSNVLHIYRTTRHRHIIKIMNCVCVWNEMKCIQSIIFHKLTAYDFIFSGLPLLISFNSLFFIFISLLFFVSIKLPEHNTDTSTRIPFIKFNICKKCICSDVILWDPWINIVIFFLSLFHSN